MKILRLALISLSALAAVCCGPSLKTTASADSYDVYLLIGQSNMAGRGEILPEDMSPREGVFLLDSLDRIVPATEPFNIHSTIRKRRNMQGFNLGDAFAETMHQKTGRKILLVVNARGGSGLDQWLKTSAKITFNKNEGDDAEKIGSTAPQFYAEAVRRAQIAMQHGQLKGILWHQGESDASEAKSATYLERLSGMVSDLRSDLEVGESVRFVVGETVPVYQRRENINPVLNKVPSVIPNSACVSSSDCSSRSDNLHFDRAGLLILGRRYAEALLGE